MSEDLTVPQSDDQKLTLILTTVQALSDRVDTGFQKMDAGFHQMGTDILQLQEGQRALSAEVRAVRRDIENRTNLIYDKLAQIDLQSSDLHDRVTRLELNTSPPNSQT